MRGPDRPRDLKSYGSSENYSDAEIAAAEALVDCFLQKPDLLPKSGLTEHDFFDPLLRAVFSEIGRRVEQHSDVDSVTVAGALGLDLSDLRRIRGGANAEPRLGDYANLVKEGALKRRIKRTVVQADNRLRANEDSGQVLESLISDLTLCRRGDDVKITSPQLLSNEIENIIELKRRKDAGENVRLGIPTGLTTLDSYTGGLMRGVVTAGGAVTKIGKSSFALQVAEAAALAGLHVHHFPLEDKATNTLHRLIAKRTGITAQELRSLRFETKDIERLRRVKQDLNPVLQNIYFDDDGGLTGSEIAARIRRHAYLHNTAIAIVDYLQLVRPGPGEDENVSIINTMRELQAVAKDCNIAILVLSQLNDRTVTKRGEENFARTGEFFGYVPQFSDFKWSSAIEEGSKLVLLFHRPAFFDRSQEDDEFQIIVALNNFGEGGGKVLPYQWDGKFTRIINKLKRKSGEAN